MNEQERITEGALTRTDTGEFGPYPKLQLGNFSADKKIAVTTWIEAERRFAADPTYEVDACLAWEAIPSTLGRYWNHQDSIGLLISAIRLRDDVKDAAERVHNATLATSAARTAAREAKIAAMEALRRLRACRKGSAQKRAAIRRRRRCLATLRETELKVALANVIARLAQHKAREAHDRARVAREREVRRVTCDAY